MLWLMLIVPLTPVLRLLLSFRKPICFISPLAEAFRHLDCRHLTTEENLALSFGCEEALAGLYQTLNFMGESLLTMAGEGQEHFAYESICQLGHSLVNISQLIPALAQLEAKADQTLLAVA
jgi:hypothetical protein